MELVAEMTQRLQQVNPKTYVGTGKVQQAQELLQKHDCNTLVFDAELTPGQQKSLENALNRDLLQNDFLGNDREIKVIDRTALILDIFAQHAKTREGKLQVDLALHEYRKPRLTKLWTHLERQSASGGSGMGVVGLRGPGESQLEMDKRLLRDRILVLKEKINQVQKQRELHRRGRRRTGLPILSLVGYTNAGKSTLLNTLTQAGVMAESMLFATLDPTTRKVQLPTNTDASAGNSGNGGLMKTRPEVLLTDTVGFIQKLPTHLVAAFRATLEEVQYADVLLHVIDVSNPTWPKQEQAVLSVLRDIGCANKPMIRILNKIDLLPPYEASFLCQTAAQASAMPHQQPFYTVAVSAARGDGMHDFVAVVEEALSDLLVPIEVEIPYSRGEELNLIHEQGNVETVDYRVDGTYVVARVPRSVANRVQQYSLAAAVVEPMALSNQFASAATSTAADDDDWVAIGRGRHSSKRG
jgi:GTP-binding protein HflX